MPNYGVFTVEQFGILRWKANEKMNLLMVSKLKYDTYSPSNRVICLNNPYRREEKPCVCSVQYIHSNPHTLLLTSRSLACKDRKLVFTLKLLEGQRMLWGRVEWFSLFFDFRKWAHCYQLALFLWVKFQKIDEFFQVRTPRTRCIFFIFKNS